MSVALATNPEYESTPFGAITPIEWSAFCAEFIQGYSPKLRAVSTRKSVARVLRIMAEHGCQSTRDITVGLISRLIESRPPGQSSYTTRGLLRNVQCIANYAVATRRLAFSPFLVRPLRNWVRLEAPRAGTKHLSIVEIGRLLSLLRLDVEERRGWSQWRSRRLLAVVAIAAYAGLRKAEITHLRVEDVDLKARFISVVSRAEHRTKTAGSAADVPMATALVPIIQEWLLHRLDSPGFARESPYLFPNINTATPWVNGSNGCKPLERLQAAAKRAGIDVCTFQMLRRSCATHIVGCNGGGTAMAQRVLRHSSSQVTEEFYIQSDRNNLLKAVDGLQYE